MIDFPSTPTDGQEYTSGDRTWVWRAAVPGWDIKPVGTSDANAAGASAIAAATARDKAKDWATKIDAEVEAGQGYGAKYYSTLAATTLANKAENADLASTVDAAKGAGRIGFAAALAYAAGTVGAFLKTLATRAELAATAGAALIGFTQGGTGAAGRTISDKLRDFKSILDFTTTTAAVDAIQALGGGTLKVPNSSAASLPASTGNVLLDYDGPDIPVTMFGEGAGTFYIGQRVLRRQSSNAHAGKGQSVTHVENLATGTGSSGPTNADIGSSISVIKKGFNGGGPASGELDGLYVAVRNDGADADSCALLMDVGNYGVGFNGAWESVTTGFTAGVATQQVNAQGGIVDTRTNKQYGYVATKAIGVGGIGNMVQQTGTAQWASVLQYINPAGVRFDMPVDANGVPSIKLYDSAGVSKTVRINAGALSILNSAGGAELLSMDDTGNATFAGKVSGGAIEAAAALTSKSPTAGVGYSTGAGGTVTQATSKSTGVTLNKASGQIVMNAASLAASGIAQFVVTNSAVGANDTVVCHRGAGGTNGAYWVFVDAVAAGSFRVYVQNITAGALAEAVTLNFNVIKGVIA